jgi:hypothetical protein
MSALRQKRSFARAIVPVYRSAVSGDWTSLLLGAVFNNTL